MDQFLEHNNYNIIKYLKYRHQMIKLKKYPMTVKIKKIMIKMNK